MIDWATLQPGLQALVATLTGLAVGDVTWSGAKQTFAAQPKFAKAELQAFGNRSVGTLDALTWDELTADGPMVQTALGVRELTLRVKVTCYDQRPGFTARNYLEMLRDRLPWDSARDSLAALSLGFQSVLSLTDLSTPADSHVASVGAIDVRLNVATTDRDPTQYSRISTVNYDPTYE